MVQVHSTTFGKVITMLARRFYSNLDRQTKTMTSHIKAFNFMIQADEKTFTVSNLITGKELSISYDEANVGFSNKCYGLSCALSLVMGAYRHLSIATVVLNDPVIKNKFEKWFMLLEQVCVLLEVYDERDSMQLTDCFN